ncbi:hypothetical protein TNCV_2076831 [Trichonephila clavipes]|nr:hypothetical protein TNCV_2076831 [Trichonephila clavipes]
MKKEVLCVPELRFIESQYYCSRRRDLTTVSRIGNRWVQDEHQDGRIRIRWRRGERTLAACICHRSTSPSPGMIVGDAIGYTSRSPLVRNDGSLNSAQGWIYIWAKWAVAQGPRFLRGPVLR